MSAETTVFPSVDLVPKKETKALDFLKEHPDYDGRNVRVGIIDTGIDPGAHGLRFMADGTTPKLINMVDCTGSGDVDVSKEVEAKRQPDGSWKVKGASGKTLLLSKDWKICPFPKSNNNTKQQQKTESSDESKKDSSDQTNEAVKVRVGLKRAYELFPDRLTSRVKAHRKIQFDKDLSKYIATVRQQLTQWKENHRDKLSPDEIKERDDIQAILEALSDSEWEDDPGLMLEIVVFYDGENYRAVIDTKDDGDLRQLTPLTDFEKELQFGTISTIDQYNYAVHFFEDGKILNIMGDSSPHGSHVAGITAAAEGERSGVAPGAELVSLKIGDSRLSSMETGTSLARAIMWAARLKCDIVNLSYGEGCKRPNKGRVFDLAEELVWRHNIMFVSSAGNEGPALTTAGAPGGQSSAILGIGAYVSPAMMKADYSLISNNRVNDDDPSSEDFIGTMFTWSSVGPTADGHTGVDVCGPGGAITSVSNWTMQKSMLMSGTSMSSPNVCGNIALLMSACKAEGIPISSPRIQRALANTALFQSTDNPSLREGWGLVQVDKAYEHLKKCKDFDTEDIHFEVEIDTPNGRGRGIYLRQPEETVSAQTFYVMVKPEFRRVDDVDEESQRKRTKFEMQFSLTSTADWVKVPEYFALMNNGRSFKIDVDPTGLSPGLHTAKVCAIDAQHPERGIIWSSPITVAKPLSQQRYIDLGELEHESGEIKRFFVEPPPGATWMDVTVQDTRNPSEDGGSATRMFVLHLVQLVPQCAFRDNHTRKYLNLLPSQTMVTSMSVHAGITCEVAFARFWSASGKTKSKVTIEFRGVRPEPSNIIMCCGDSGSLVTVSSDLQNESINPSAKLTKWKTPIRPKTEGVISPLGDRDIQPWSNKKTYQLILTYEFTQDEKGAFTPRAPALQDVLYEAIYESQLMLVFDGDKKYLGSSDAYPSSVTAPKGTVVIRMQIRHEDPAMLEKHKDMVLWIERKLEKEITLAVYASREDSMIGAKKAFRKRTLRKGTSTSVFFAEPQYSKLPSSCKSGDILLGSAFYASGDTTLPGEGKRPGGFPISYTVGPKMDKPSEDDTVEPKDDRTAEEKINEAVRDLRVDMLSKLSSSDKEAGKFEELYATLEKEYPDHVPLFMANLKYLDSHKERFALRPKIIEAADKVIAQISEDDLALHFGKKLDKEDPEKVKINKEMEKKKSFLVEALTRKASVLIMPSSTTTSTTTTTTTTTTSSAAAAAADDDNDKSSLSLMFDETLNKLKSWVDIDANGKYAALAIERDLRLKRYGAALKRINKLLSKPSKESSGGIKTLSKSELREKRIYILNALGFTALVDRATTMQLVSNPSDYPLF